MLTKLKQKRHLLLLVSILALSAFLAAWGLWRQGDSNAYYLAAVKSMLTSGHNFFFASFDPGGFITVDKPALGLWLQAVSAAVLGVHGWSVILPEALCAVVSAWVIYRLVRASFGEAAGLLSALALALTPIVAAVARTNELDASLMLTVLLAAWAAEAAARRGRLRLLLLSMALLGLGFNIKMLQAWMALPAVAAVYLFTAKVNLGKRLLHLTAGVIVLLAVSLSWALAVDLTPAADRPYVGGSKTNSVLELALDYNGVQRITGVQGAGSQPPGAAPASPGGAGQDGQSPGGPAQGGPPQGSGRGGFGQGGQSGPGGVSENGAQGMLRLFDKELAGQISWLAPMALFGLLALALGLRGGAESRQNALRHLVLWACWVLQMAAFFSVSGFFHRYYLCMLAPGLAALAGIGAALLWRFYRQGGWMAWLLPAAVASTAALQCFFLSRYSGWPAALLLAVAALAAVAALGFAVALLLRRQAGRVSPVFAAVALAALLAAPAAWSLTPILYGSQANLPYAGPELAGGGGGNFNPGGMSQGGGGGVETASALTQFLIENNHGEKFLAAVPDAGSAEPIILATGKPVMAVGGFSGNDAALSLDRLEALVKAGELRYFLVTGRGASELDSWVQTNGKEVPASAWGGSGLGFNAGGTLYDLAGTP